MKICLLVKVGPGSFSGRFCDSHTIIETMFDQTWSSLKALSSMNFSCKSTSEENFGHGSFTSSSFSKSYPFSSKFCIEHSK